MAAPRVFSLAMATRALPLVRSIAADLVRTRAERDALFEQLTHADLVERSGEPAGLFQRIGRLHEAEAELTRELAALGIRVVDPRVGRVVFPARLEGLPGLLFWRLGQEQIEEWRPIHAGPGLPSAQQQIGRASCRERV